MRSVSARALVGKPPGSKPASAFPWEPHSARRGRRAMDGLRQMLMRRLRVDQGLHPQTLLCAVGALAGFAAQNAALEQGQILARRRDLVAPRSLLLFTSPTGQRFLFGSWVNAPLLAGYGHATPLQRFLAQAGEDAGIEREHLPDFRSMEARVSGTVAQAGFGVLQAPMGHAPAAQPGELLRALWPQTRRILAAPMPLELPDEPDLNQAHWPVIISVLAGAMLTSTRDRLDPRIGIALVMESALIAARLDPETVDPGRWDLAPAAGGLSVQLLDQRRRAAG
jgi:hypothetical protein